jgi:putative peptidoglycan lipid II flippase
MLTLLFQLAVAGLIGLLVFGAIASVMKLPEIDTFVVRMRKKILKK